MEKLKKIVKILPWALLIIAITAIVAEVRYINLEDRNYSGYNETLAETARELEEETDVLQAKADELEAKAVELQEKIVNLQGKADFYQEQIDSYGDNPKQWQSAVNDLSKQVKQIYTADKEALDSFATALFMKASEKIAKGDYSTFPEFPIYRYNSEGHPYEITQDGIKCVLRDENAFFWVEEDYYDIFTDELAKKVLEKSFVIVEDDGRNYYYFKEQKNKVPEWGVANAELTRISEKGDEIKYSVKYDREEQGTITDKGLTCTMTIKYEEGRYRISETDFGNL